jgi:hypothetical protein
MKNSIILSVVLSLFFLDVKLQASKGNPENSSTCLEIEGRVTNIGRKTDNTYKVELISANVVIKTLNINDKKVFQFTLKKNSHYAIRISKKGFVPRLISIHTVVPGDDKRVHRFQFDMELLSVKDARKLNDDALDFPVAVISYDNEMSSFYYNEEYTANIKRQLYTGKYF